MHEHTRENLCVINFVIPTGIFISIYCLNMVVNSTERVLFKGRQRLLGIKLSSCINSKICFEVTNKHGAGASS